jgi:hypothetical protein
VQPRPFKYLGKAPQAESGREHTEIAGVVERIEIPGALEGGQGLGGAVGQARVETGDLRASF